MTEMVDSSAAPTGAACETDNTGGNIVIDNQFGVDIIVEIRTKPGGVLVATKAVGANSTTTDVCTLADGDYDIYIREANQQGPGTDCGDLVVL